MILTTVKIEWETTGNITGVTVGSRLCRRNENPQIEEEQTTQWPMEKGQNGFFLFDRQRNFFAFWRRVFGVFWWYLNNGTI
jgi:hypothetical protein